MSKFPESDLYNPQWLDTSEVVIPPRVDLFSNAFLDPEEASLSVEKEDKTSTPYQLDLALFQFFVKKYPESPLNNIDFFRKRLESADRKSLFADYSRLNGFLANHAPNAKNDEVRMAAVVLMQKVLFDMTRCMDEAYVKLRREKRDHTILTDRFYGAQRDVFIHIDPKTKDRKMLCVGTSLLDPEKKESVLLTFPGSEELNTLQLPIAHFDVLTPEQMERALSIESSNKFFELGDIPNLDVKENAFVASPTLLFQTAEMFRNFAEVRTVDPRDIANWNEIMRTLEEESDSC